MDDASDRRQIRKAERLAKAKAEQSSATLAWIMSTKQGREWVCDTLELCHIGTTSFTPNPYISAFRAGEQNIGIQLWSAVQQACPDLYILMMGEQAEKKQVQAEQNKGEIQVEVEQPITEENDEDKDI